MRNGFEHAYPSIAAWVETQGWVEIGNDDESGSFVRALDEGGMVWEGRKHYNTLDDALRDLEQGLKEWMD